MTDFLSPTQALLTRLVEARVERTLAAALVDFRGGTIDPQKAVVVLAQIAALRQLLTDLTKPDPN